MNISKEKFPAIIGNFSLPYEQKWGVRRVDQRIRDFLLRIKETKHPDEIRVLQSQWMEQFGDDPVMDPIHDVVQGITICHDSMVKKVLEWTKHQLEQEGRQIPNVSFCWVTMGSGGRCEQTFHTDQDHALLYKSSGIGDEKTVEPYFALFAERAVAALERAGYPLCSGYVMSSNPRWRGSLQDFREKLTSYLSCPNWENVRYLLIASDMRPIYGNPSLGEEIRVWLVQQMSRSPFILWQVADHERSHDVALDSFGRLRTDRTGEYQGKLNLKEGLYLHLVNHIRLWTIAHGGAETQSFSRIQYLQEKDIWSCEWADQVREALAITLKLRVKEHSRQSKRGIFDPYINPDELEIQERLGLQEALKTTKQLKKLAAKRFRKP